MKQALKKLEEQGHEIIVGTGHTPDYVVLARHPKTGAKVGVKMMFGPVNTDHGGVPALFMRIRLQKVDEAEVVQFSTKEKTSFPDAADWASSYPEMEWEKTNEVRRSTVVGVASPRQGKENLWMMPYDFDAAGTFTSIRDWLLKRIPRQHWKLSTGEFKDFLREALTEFLAGAPSPPTKEAIQYQIDVHKKELDQLLTQLAGMSGSVKDFLTPLEGTITPVGQVGELSDYLSPGDGKPSLTLHEGGSEGGKDGSEEADLEVDDDDKADDPTEF